VRRDGAVALDQRRCHAAQRLDAQGQRRHIQQEDIVNLSTEHTRLDCSAQGHHFVRVETLVWRPAEHFLYTSLHQRRARLPTHEDDLVDIVHIQLCVLQRLAAGADAALYQILNELLELAACERHREVLGAAGIRRDKRQIDLSLRRGRQLDLGLFGGLLEALQSHSVVAQIDALILAILFYHPVDHPLVKVVTAKERVTVSRTHLKDAFSDIEDRDVKGATAKVIDGDLLIVRLVQPIGER